VNRWITVAEHRDRQDAMAQRPVFRLAEAVLLFLFLLLPMMLLLGAAEGTAGRPTLVFWVLWLLPLLVLPWLWNRRNPEENLEPRSAVDGANIITNTHASEFGLAIAPVLDVRRSYVHGGLAIAEGRLKTTPSIAFDQLQGLP
jgi:hypothetical protein